MLACALVAFGLPVFSNNFTNNHSVTLKIVAIVPATRRVVVSQGQWRTENALSNPNQMCPAPRDAKPNPERAGRAGSCLDSLHRNGR